VRVNFGVKPRRRTGIRGRNKTRAIFTKHYTEKKKKKILVERDENIYS